MIKRCAENEGKVTSNLRGGIGYVTMFHFLTEQEANGAGRLFSKTVIEPGNSIGMHTHVGDMETYYILKGKALVSDNGNEVIMEPGDCHVCPDGNSHFIKSIGEETLEFIAIVLYTKQKDV
jgi:mannose-6-phosphate isomerase-like protein (cupin superfamily)